MIEKAKWISGVNLGGKKVSPPASYFRREFDLNKEVSRTVLILSTILQATDLFSKEAPAESIIKLIVNHLKHLIRAEVCFCVLENKIKNEFDPVALVGVDSTKIDNFFKKRSKEFIRLRYSCGR